jgi:AcrR family transcriptional regulator
MPSSSARRTRRSSEEVRALLVAAALECFAERGYTGATTKEIARRADVDEAVLFRTFPSKRSLYEAAVVHPFDAFIARYTERWVDAPAPIGTPQEVLRQFVEELYDIVREHRALFAAMAGGDHLLEGVQPALDRLEEMGKLIARTYDLDFDAHVAVRVAATTVVAVAMTGDQLFAPGVGRQRILDEVVRMLTGATVYRPESRGR